MPRIKRWFPVSHDINRDPEVHELCKRFGVTGLRAWLECLSIADRNEGELPGAWSAYPGILAGACQSTPRHLRGICEWLTSHLRDGCEMPTSWLRVNHEGIASVVNYWKYNRAPEQKKFSPDLPDLTRPKRTTTESAQALNGFAEFYDEYPKKKSRGQAEKAWRAISPDDELRQKITVGLKRAKSSHDWLKQSGQFIPYPSSWLRAKGWEDQGFVKITTAPTNGHVKQPEPVLSKEDIERNQQFLRETIVGLSGKMGVGK